MRVQIENFQSLGRVDIEVGGLTVVVGPSDRGKSALIRAIEGALFNRPGSQFVRLGQKLAKVALCGLPAADGSTLDVEWVKGDGKNKYTVNGTEYKKVGQGAPPVLDEAGYRDVWIGDKERKKGSYIRPQVAGQFEPLFLLTQPGSFVADVLGSVSRHSVLLTAQDRVASDARSAKQQVGLRRADLEAAERRQVALAGVPALVERIGQLLTYREQLTAFRERVEAVRRLVARRPVLVPLAVLQAPAVPPVATVVGLYGKQMMLSDLTARRRRLLPLSRVEWQRYEGIYQESVWRVVAFEGRVEDIRRKAARRPALVQLAAVAVPVITDPSLWQSAGRFTDMAPLVVARHRYARLATATVPARFPDRWLPLIGDWAARAGSLARGIEVRRALLQQLQAATAANKAAKVEVEVTRAAFDTLKTEVKICPVCDKAF